MKRIYLLFLALAVLTGLSACKNEKNDTNEPLSTVNPTAMETETAVSLHQEPTAPADITTYSSPLGYSCSYDSALFKLSNAEGMDVLDFIPMEKAPFPVGITVQLFEELSAEQLIEGLILQKSIEHPNIQKTTIGEKRISATELKLETKPWNFEQESEYMVTNRYVALDAQQGALLVEINSAAYLTPDQENRTNTALFDNGTKQILDSITLSAETGIHLFIEGEPTLLPTVEYETPYYKLSLTKDEWNRTMEPDSLYPTDSWTCCYNEGIRFNVVHLGKIQAADGLKCVREQHSSYNFDEADPLVLSGMDLADSYFLQGRIFSDSENTFAVYGEFPMEAGDGFVPRINAMVDSFQIAQP